MASLLYIVAIITVSSVIKPSNQAHMVSYFCSGKDTYYKDSTYQTNLVSLFTELASVASLVRSYDAAAGSGSDRVHAFFYCRHDLTSELCQSCVRNASESIMQLCLYETEATIWNEECTLRYAGQSVVQSEKEESSPWAWWYDSCGVKMVSSRKQLLNKALTNLIKGLVNKSTSGDKPKLFAKGEAFVTMRETLYGTVECSPWISPYKCKKCLITAWSRIGSSCGGTRWAVAFLSSCQVRYHLGPFSPSSSTSSPFSSFSKSVASF